MYNPVLVLGAVQVLLLLLLLIALGEILILMASSCKIVKQTCSELRDFRIAVNILCEKMSAHPQPVQRQQTPRNITVEEALKHLLAAFSDRYAESKGSAFIHTYAKHAAHVIAEACKVESGVLSEMDFLTHTGLIKDTELVFTSKLILDSFANLASTDYNTVVAAIRILQRAGAQREAWEIIQTL